jgi:hypothetical protein
MNMKKDTPGLDGEILLSRYFIYFLQRKEKKRLQKNSTQHPITSLALMQTEKSGEA